MATRSTRPPPKSIPFTELTPSGLPAVTNAWYDWAMNIRNAIDTLRIIVGDPDGDGVVDDVNDLLEAEVTLFARDMLPTVTGGCSALTTVEFGANQPNFHALLFDPTADESADVTCTLPFSWAGRSYKIQIYWGHDVGATTYGVVWEVSANATGDEEVLIRDFGVGTTIVDSRTTTAGNLYVTTLSGTVPISSAQNDDGDLVNLRIHRRPSNPSDQLDLDAALIAVRFTLGGAIQPPPAATAGELYLRFEGDFADSSASARTVTNSGAARSTSHPGGGSSEGFVGNGSGYLTVVDDGWADIGSRIFQLRFHLYVATAATLATDNIICGKWGAVDGSWFVNINGSNGRLNWGAKAGSYFYDSITDAAIPRDTLIQVTIWRYAVSGQIFCALDGITQAANVTRTPDTTTHNFAFGAVVGGGAALPAGVYADEFHFKIDETDYPSSANFTPPPVPYL